MRAIISVIGTDRVGILAKIAGLCADNNINIIHVNQKVVDGMFTMVMQVEIDKCTVPFSEFALAIQKAGSEIGMTVNAMHEDIFNSMHRI